MELHLGAALFFAADRWQGIALVLSGFPASVFILRGVRIVGGVFVLVAAQAVLEIRQTFAQAGAYFRQSAGTEQQQADDEEQNEFPETGHACLAVFGRMVRRFVKI